MLNNKAIARASNTVSSNPRVVPRYRRWLERWPTIEDHEEGGAAQLRPHEHRHRENEGADEEKKKANEVLRLEGHGEFIHGEKGGSGGRRGVGEIEPAGHAM